MRRRLLPQPFPAFSALNGKQNSLSAASSLDLASLTAATNITTSLVKAPTGSALMLGNSAGAGLIVESSGSVGVLTTPTVPLDIYGDAAVSGNLSVGGTDVLTEIAAAALCGGASLDASSNAIQRVVAGGATSLDSAASAFEDIECANLPASSIRPPSERYVKAGCLQRPSAVHRHGQERFARCRAELHLALVALPATLGRAVRRRI